MDEDQVLNAILDKGIAEGLDDAELKLLVQDYKAQQPKATAPPAAATAGMPGQSLVTDKPRTTGDNIRDTIRLLGTGILGPQLTKDTEEHPIATPLTLVGEGLVGRAAKLAPYAGPAMKKAGEMLENPLAGGVAGGAEGYRRGGWTGAIQGALAGAAGSTILGKGLTLAGKKLSPDAPIAPKGELAIPDDFQETLRRVLSRDIDSMGSRPPVGDVPDVPFAVREGDAPAWAEAVATKRQMPDVPESNAGGTLLPKRSSPIEEILEGLRAQPSHDPPTSTYLPPQARGLPPTADSAESVARQLVQGTKSADDVAFDARVFESEFPKPTPAPKPVSSMIQKLSEAARQPASFDMAPMPSHTSTVAPAATPSESLMRRLVESINPRSTTSKGVKLSPNDVRFLQERGLSIDDYEHGVPAVVAAVEEARKVRHATKYSNAQADAQYRKRIE